ncbi:MAG: AbiV family abortive infection protein [Thaumarchaeota archaeon]|nr:AbiV family abortive infection protein [Nitrososphaerota archaeon]
MTLFDIIMPRHIAKKIPWKMIPEGINLCLNNAVRLLEDAMILLENDRIQNGLVNGILAQEEFAKVLFLYSHYEKNKGKDISKTQVGKKFRLHRPRLKLYHKLEFQRKGLAKYNRSIVKYTKEASTMQQHLKEVFTYVDWAIYEWQSPSHPFGIINLQGIKKQVIDEIVTVLLENLKQLLQDKRFVKIIYSTIIETPKANVINKIIIKYCKDAKGVSITTDENEIQISLNTKSGNLDAKIKKQINDELVQRYTEHEINIFYEEKNWIPLTEDEKKIKTRTVIDNF